MTDQEERNEAYKVLRVGCENEVCHEGGVVSCSDAPPTRGEERLVTLLDFLGPNLCA